MMFHLSFIHAKGRNSDEKALRLLVCAFVTNESSPLSGL